MPFTRSSPFCAAFTAKEHSLTRLSHILWQPWRNDQLPQLIAFKQQMSSTKDIVCSGGEMRCNWIVANAFEASATRLRNIPKERTNEINYNKIASVAPLLPFRPHLRMAVDHQGCWLFVMPGTCHSDNFYLSKYKSKVC